MAESESAINAANAAPGAAATPDNEPAKADRPRVLVTDDDPVIRAVVTSLLEKEHFVVTTAADGDLQA